MSGEDEEPYYLPQISRPDYGRGFYYCVRCMRAYKDAEVCPNCGIKTRKKGRKNGRGDKPRVDFDGINGYACRQLQLFLP